MKINGFLSLCLALALSLLPALAHAGCTTTFVTMPDGRVMQCQQCDGGQVICS